MEKQVMDINALGELLASTYGTSKVLVQANDNILTIEPLSKDTPEANAQEIRVGKPEKSTTVDETKAGTLTLDDFTEIKLFTKGYKFNRGDAYERD
jgi:hypothetical protein